MKFLLQFFTWWSGQTLNTRFHTWRHGEKVGEDQFGNLYYRTRGGAIDPALGFERRWVIYNGQSEASSVPPGWYGWLHHTSNVPPPDEKYVAHEWELPHLPNMTGTPAAWRPEGSMAKSGTRPPATGDYRAWSPGESYGFIELCGMETRSVRIGKILLLACLVAPLPAGAAPRKDPFAAACMAKKSASAAKCACQAKLARANLDRNEQRAALTALRGDKARFQKQVVAMGAERARAFDAKMKQLGDRSRAECR